MTSDKALCASIMLCQMTAILSGVSLLYLAVIVVIPSKLELELGFSTTPIMCTTVKAEDINLRNPKGDMTDECKWGTCGEWCLSKSTATCMQIHVAARKNSSKVTFSDCVDIEDFECSALNVSLSYPWKCKEGQCASLNQGIYDCDREGDNVCRRITPAYECSQKPEDTPIICTEKCKERLHGVYSCNKGECYKIKKVSKYYEDCTRKCTDLNMKDRNTVIFSKDRLVYANCKSVSSSTEDQDNNTISSINSDVEWSHHKSKVAFLFCTYVTERLGVPANYELVMEDCFNGTLGDASRVINATDYRELLNYHQELTAREDTELLIHTEESLSLMNVTRLLINTQGCSNTLSKVCEKFFLSHASDGLNGQTADRFPCYYSEKDYSYVIAVYNPEMTYIFLMLASIVPGSLFFFACMMLLLCSKSVGVNDEGHLYVKLFKGAGGGVAKEPVQFDELL